MIRRICAFGNRKRQPMGARVHYPPLHQWAEHFNLDAVWVKARGLETLADWARLRATDAQAGRAYSVERLLSWGWTHEGSAYWMPLTDEEELFCLQTMPGYHPDTETRADAESRIRGAFDAYLRAHLDKIEELMLERGWRKKDEKRSPMHFEWAARYQVCGQSCEQIASAVRAERIAEQEQDMRKPRERKRKYGDERRHTPETFTAKAVEDAVDKILAVIGLTRRSGN
jgi:hypothetical protein